MRFFLGRPFSSSEIKFSLSHYQEFFLILSQRSIPSDEGNCTRPPAVRCSESNRYPGMVNKQVHCGLQVTCPPPREQMQPKSKGHSRSQLRGRCQAPGAGAHTSLSANPKAALGGPRDQEDWPRGRAFRGSEGSAGSHPERATWARAWHSPVHTLQARESRGPLQVRNQSPGTAKPSHAAQPREHAAFPSRWAAVAVGAAVPAASGGGPAGVSSLTLAPTSGRGTAAGRELSPALAAALRRQDAAVRRYGAPYWGPGPAPPAMLPLLQKSLEYVPSRCRTRETGFPFLLLCSRPLRSRIKTSFLG